MIWSFLLNPQNDGFMVKNEEFIFFNYEKKNTEPNFAI